MQKAVIGSGHERILERKKSYMVFSFNINREIMLLSLLVITAIVYLGVILIPILTLFKASGLSNMLSAITSGENASAFRISFFTTTITLIPTFLLGTPMAFLLASMKGKLYAKVFEGIITMPAVLPPAVAGIGLLVAFGSNGWIGSILKSMDIEVVFTPAAVILAQVFVSMGFYIQVLRTGVDAVNPEVFEASYTLGAGRLETFVRIIIPMLKKPIIAGLILAWTRALGEFGATIMFAGNVLGKTRTVPLQIYTLMQTDMPLAASLSAVLFIVSFTMLVIVKICLEGEYHGTSS